MTTTLPTLTTPNVTTSNGKVTTNSRDVAALFGKRHDSVLRSIYNLDCSPEFTDHNFVVSEYRDASGRKHYAYDMTKDGFTLLAMGFTGKQAARFKEMRRSLSRGTRD